VRAARAIGLRLRPEIFPLFALCRQLGTGGRFGPRSRWDQGLVLRVGFLVSG